MSARHRLTNMVIKEISLVPEGDNPEAHVLIAKRRAPAPGGDGARLVEIGKALEAAVEAGGATTEVADAAAFLKHLGGNMDEIEKKLAEIEKNLAAVTTRAETAEAALATVTKERDDALAIVNKAKADAGQSDEEMLKSLPEAARQMIEKARNDAALASAAVEKMTKERETGEFITKARDLGIGDANDVGGLLYRVAKGATTADDVGVLEGVLKSAAAAQAPLFQPAGKTVVRKSGANAAEAELQGKADDIRKAKPDLSAAEAYAKALDENPELYDRYLAERNG